MTSKPSASYSFNSMQEIKSHSSILYNERMAILFYLLDMRSITLNSNKDFRMINPVLAILKQIYKNVRTLIRNNPVMRKWLHLETEKKGVYVTDIAFMRVEAMIRHCEVDIYTVKKLDIIINELNNIEVLIKDCLQYYNYFIRPDFKQKPDVEMATEMYKQMGDENSINDLREVVGPNHMIDFDSLGGKVTNFAPSKQLESAMDKVLEDDEDDEEDDI